MSGARRSPAWRMVGRARDVGGAIVSLVRVGLEDVRSAAVRIAGGAHRTPVLTARTLNELTGAEVFLKAENLQRVGAFKFRGADNAVSRLSDEQLAKGIAAYSLGNHAQA